MPTDWSLSVLPKWRFGAPRSHWRLVTPPRQTSIRSRRRPALRRPITLGEVGAAPQYAKDLVIRSIRHPGPVLFRTTFCYPACCLIGVHPFDFRWHPSCQSWQEAGHDEFVFHEINSDSVSFAGPGHVGRQSGPHDKGPRLCGPDHKIVKIAAHLESARQFASPILMGSNSAVRIKCSTSSLPCSSSDTFNRTAGSGRPVARGLEEIGRHGAERDGKVCPDREPPSNNLAR